MRYEKAFIGIPILLIFVLFAIGLMLAVQEDKRSGSHPERDTLESRHCVFSWMYSDAPQTTYMESGNEEVPIVMPGQTHTVYKCDDGEETW